MSLDYSTLGLISLVVTGVNSLLLVAAAVMWRRLPGPLWWALGGLASIVTALGFSLPGATIDPALLVSAMAGNLANAALTHRGLVLFIGRRDGLLSVPLIAVIALGAGSILTGLDLAPARALVFLAGITAIGGMIVVTLARHGRGRSRVPFMIVAAVYAAVIGVLFYRWITMAWGDSLGLLGQPDTREAISMIAAIVLSNLRLFGLGLMVAARLQDEATSFAEAMRRDARQDVLTGLANRRALFDCADRLHADWPRQGSYAVVMLDLDRFKEINDRFGHGGGDEALRIVAAYLGATARPQDIVARLGGEEFVIVLPACNTAEAMAAAEAMRLGMHRLTVVIAGQTVEVTASLGLAIVGREDIDFEAVLGRADNALYAAKAAGRDRVKLAPAGNSDVRHSRAIRRGDRALGAPDRATAPVVIDGARHFLNRARHADARRNTSDLR